MSKVKDLITRARMRIKDPISNKYSDYELLDYFNDACDFLGLELISQKDSEMVCELSQAMNQALPDNFVEFAGQYPVYLKNSLCIAQDGVSTSVTIRYFGQKNRVTANDNCPFKSIYDTILVQLTAIFSLSRDSGGIPQDENTLNQVRNNIITIKQKQQAAAQ